MPTIIVGGSELTSGRQTQLSSVGASPLNEDDFPLNAVSGPNLKPFTMATLTGDDAPRGVGIAGICACAACGAGLGSVAEAFEQVAARAGQESLWLSAFYPCQQADQSVRVDLLP
jgi:hypothetical protein